MLEEEVYHILNFFPHWVWALALFWALISVAVVAFRGR